MNKSEKDTSYLWDNRRKFKLIFFFTMNENKSVVTLLYNNLKIFALQLCLKGLIMC